MDFEKSTITQKRVRNKVQNLLIRLNLLFIVTMVLQLATVSCSIQKKISLKNSNDPYEIAVAKLEKKLIRFIQKFEKIFNAESEAPIREKKYPITFKHNGKNILIEVPTKKELKLLTSLIEYEEEVLKLEFLNKVREEVLKQKINEKSLQSGIVEEVLKRDKVALLEEAGIPYDVIELKPKVMELSALLDSIDKRFWLTDYFLEKKYHSEVESSIVIEKLNDLEEVAQLAKDALRTREIILFKGDVNEIDPVSIEISNNTLEEFNEVVFFLKSFFISLYHSHENVDFASFLSSILSGTGPKFEEGKKFLEGKKLLEGKKSIIDGTTGFLIADSMPLNNRTKVFLSIAGENKHDYLREEIIKRAKTNDSSINTADISIGRLMKATLRDPLEKIKPKFLIEPFPNKEVQLIDLYNRDIIDWTWNVIPLEEGEHELNLSLEVMVKNDLGDHSYVINLFEGNIRVYNTNTSLFQADILPDIQNNIKDKNSPTAEEGLAIPTKLSEDISLRNNRAKDATTTSRPPTTAVKPSDTSQTSSTRHTLENLPEEKIQTTQNQQETKIQTSKTPYKFLTTLIILFLLMIILLLIFRYLKPNAVRPKELNHEPIAQLFSLEDVDRLEQLFKENKIVPSLKLILSRLSEVQGTLKTQALLSLRNYKQNERDFNLNLIPYEKYSQNCAITSNSLLQMINDLKELKGIRQDG